MRNVPHVPSVAVLPFGHGKTYRLSLEEMKKFEQNL